MCEPFHTSNVVFMCHFGKFQAGEFLVTQSHAPDQETELNENLHSNNDYADTASLLEQVIFLIL